MQKSSAASVGKIISTRIREHTTLHQLSTTSSFLTRKFTTSTSKLQSSHSTASKKKQIAQINLLSHRRHNLQRNATTKIFTTQKRMYSEYERPFSYFKGVLDAFMVGSRRNYVRPSVTYAAGLGNTALRHIRLHVEDYTHDIPAHRAFGIYFKALVRKKPGLLLSFITFSWLVSLYREYQRANEVYDQARDSIFALKAKNFLIKQGEKQFLETVLIMFYQGVIEPLEVPGESPETANGRFVGEIQAMLAEIERHRDFRISNIPLNYLEIHREKLEQPRWVAFQTWLAKPFLQPIHQEASEERRQVEFDTPADIYRQQRALLDPIENESSFVGKLDSSGVGSLYGLFYPLITRYHNLPTQLSVQALPLTMQRNIRDASAPMSKLVGRLQDSLVGSVLYDQFQLDHRNEQENPGYRLNIRNNLPKYWDSEVEYEIYNSYYLQRAANLIKRCRDVDVKVASSMFGEDNVYDLLKTYLSKAHRVLLNNIFSDNLQHFSPGDSHLFRYYYKKYNLVPYLNGLQYEMSELTVLRQRLVRMGRAVGIDTDIESLSPEVLNLLDPYRVVPKPSLRALTIDLGDGKIQTIGQSQPPITQTNPDTSLITAGASDSFESRSILTDEYVEFSDQSSNFANDNRWMPKLPAPRTNTTESLYTPVKIHNLVENITEHQYNIKGLTLLVDSLHHAQHTDQPRLYPCLGVHPAPISQENYYIRSLFNPLQNAFGITEDEKYVRGLLGCIDVTLLRNAAEYQRWVYLVPQNPRDLFSHVLHKLSLSVKDHQEIKSYNYLDRDALPSQLQDGYQGQWIPFSIQEETVHRKPIYFSTQVELETWGEWFYRLAGLDAHTPISRYAFDWSRYLLGYEDSNEIELPFAPNVITSRDTMQNSLEHQKKLEERERKDNSLTTKAVSLFDSLAKTPDPIYQPPHLDPQNIERQRRAIQAKPYLVTSSDNVNTRQPH